MMRRSVFGLMALMVGCLVSSAANAQNYTASQALDKFDLAIEKYWLANDCQGVETARVQAPRDVWEITYRDDCQSGMIGYDWGSMLLWEDIGLDKSVDFTDTFADSDIVEYAADCAAIENQIYALVEQAEVDPNDQENNNALYAMSHTLQTKSELWISRNATVITPAADIAVAAWGDVNYRAFAWTFFQDTPDRP